MDARLRALLDKQEIEEVVLRYGRGIDRRDFEQVRACYHPDASDHHGSFSGSVDDFVAWVEKLTAQYEWTMHLIANVLIDLAPDAGADEPSGVRAAVCESTGVSLHRGDPEVPRLSLATGFRYLDRFEDRGDGWRIAERTAIGEWSAKLPPSIWWSIPEDHLRGRRDRSDLLYQLLAGLGRA